MDKHSINQELTDRDLINGVAANRDITQRDIIERAKIKSAIDKELSQVVLRRQAWDPIASSASARRRRRAPAWRAAALILAVLAFSGVSVGAAYYINHRIYVNEEELPELDPMTLHQIAPPTVTPDEYGLYSKDYSSYDTAAQELQVPVLDSSLAADNPYMHVSVETDNKDYAVISVHNYIIGDCQDFRQMEDERYYSQGHGQIFYSPVSLTADIILSDEQLANGWSHDYLGYYQFVLNYVSSQDYRVTIVEDTVDGAAPLPDGVVSEKCAIFVADGIRYTLSGRVSVDTMKEIVDSMEQPSF